MVDKLARLVNGRLKADYLPTTLLPTGTILDYLGTNAPQGFLKCYGQEISLTTYEALFDVISNTFGLNAGSVVTADATTDEITLTSHSFSNNNVVLFTTTGTLPGGLSANTKYYVIVVDANKFKVSTTSGGNAIDITSAGTGTNKVHNNYNLPDFRGRMATGKDNMGGSSANVITNANADVLGGTFGSETHTLTVSETAPHNHTTQVPAVVNLADGATGRNAGNFQTTAASTSTGGGAPHNNLQPSLTVNKIIKT